MYITPRRHAYAMASARYDTIRSVSACARERTSAQQRTRALVHVEIGDPSIWRLPMAADPEFAGGGGSPVICCCHDRSTVSFTLSRVSCAQP